jgi:hypothetical protein
MAIDALYESQVNINGYEVRYTHDNSDGVVLVSSLDVLICQQNNTFLASAGFEYAYQYICSEIKDNIEDEVVDFELI